MHDRLKLPNKEELEVVTPQTRKCSTCKNMYWVILAAFLPNADQLIYANVVSLSHGRYRKAWPPWISDPHPPKVTFTSFLSACAGVIVLTLFLPYFTHSLYNAQKFVLSLENNLSEFSMRNIVIKQRPFSPQQESENWQVDLIH